MDARTAQTFLTHIFITCTVAVLFFGGMVMMLKSNDMANNKITVKGWLFILLNFWLVFGGFFLWIKSDYVENAKLGIFLEYAAYIQFALFFIFWAVKYATDSRNKGE